VFAFGLSESTLIVFSASGSSWTLPAEAQAPGSGVVPVPEALPVAPVVGGARWTMPLGTTFATAGSDLSDESCAAETVADTALSVV
jgi:hypothetical protein